SERRFVGLTAAGWARRWFGPRAYEALIEPILEGKIGERAPEIAMSWLWSRFHERSLRLGYLRGGFQQLYDALGERIRSYGGELRLGVAARRIRSVDGMVEIETDHGSERVRQALVTAPPPVFRRMVEGLPAGYAARYSDAESYSAQVLILALDRRLVEEYWLSIADPGFPFLVLVEHTNFMPPADYGGRHLVYLGNYLPPDHPFLRESEQELLDLFTPAIRRLNPDFKPSWVKERWLFQAPHAQPIVTPGYPERLPPLKTPLPGVYAASMAHVYPQDRGQNYSMALGERVADEMLRALDKGASRL
ncbi:MAG TPA: FAD-dependent oxidoreductase, partial [Dehalococcoidia bacterium]|nr:FAD-dependent oxidoreductase [Dehalococcoidia bacterium]